MTNPTHALQQALHALERERFAVEQQIDKATAFLQERDQRILFDRGHLNQYQPALFSTREMEGKALAALREQLDQVNADIADLQEHLQVEAEREATQDNYQLFAGE